MSRGVETRCNIVRHAWPIADDDGVAVGVVVRLTVESVDPLPPDAYPAIARVAEAGDELAAALTEIYQAPKAETGSIFAAIRAFQGKP